MAVTSGQLVTLAIEKPAAGGRMIARAEGQIVLVSGAIPGERVTARIEQVRKGVAYAETTAVDAPSADRRTPWTDPSCAGCSYAHIAYPRQLELKALVIADAFARIGRLPWPSRVAVAASPEEGYRMRARLHVRGHRIGFFREGTHDLCDARGTRQLLPATCDVLDRIGATLRSLPHGVLDQIELSENVDASERVVHLDVATAVDEGWLAAAAASPGLTGLTVNHPQPASGGPHPALDGHTIAGSAYATDQVDVGGRAFSLRRHVLAFFQGNRYLLQGLAAHVAGQIPSGSEVFDLYAGAGLFALAAAVARGARVTAVEGDGLAAADLTANAAAADGAVTPIHQSIEAFTSTSAARPEVIVIDPPRTGLSRVAMDGVVRLRAGRLVYVSCDVATLARDARRLVDAGYRIDRIDAFDLFPNTAHVETIAVFEDVRM